MPLDEDLGYIVGSNCRKLIVIYLSKGPFTPKQLSKELGIHIGNISRTLTELKKKNFIVCTTPELRKGRLYRLTEKGKEVAAMISI